MSMLLPLHVTSLVKSCAYGSDELQPGSSTKTAFVPGAIHPLKSTIWPTLFRFAASPGLRSVHAIDFETVVPNGANSLVTRPGAASPHDHEMSPEQSERYGSHSALLVRLHVVLQAVS